jgi:protein-tyrosine phosphatase
MLPAVPQHFTRTALRYVLKLYGGGPYFPPTFKTLEVPVKDGQPLAADRLKVGVGFIRQLVESGHPVLVMCAQGVSRSSTFILAYMLERGYDLRAAFFHLFYQHPDAEPHPQMWLSLIRHYRLDYSLQTVVNWPFGD